MVPKPHRRCGCNSVLILKIKKSPVNAEEAICGCMAINFAHNESLACLCVGYFPVPVRNNATHHIIDSLIQQCAEHTKTTRVVVLTLTWFNAAVHYGRKNSVVISSSIRPTSLNIRRKWHSQGVDLYWAGHKLQIWAHIGYSRSPTPQWFSNFLGHDPK